MVEVLLGQQGPEVSPPQDGIYKTSTADETDGSQNPNPSPSRLPLPSDYSQASKLEMTLPFNAEQTQLPARFTGIMTSSSQQVSYPPRSPYKPDGQDIKTVRPDSKYAVPRRRRPVGMAFEAALHPLKLSQVKSHSRSLTVPSEARVSLVSTLVSTPVHLQFPPDSPATLVAMDDGVSSNKEVLAMVGSPDEDQMRRELEILAVPKGPSLLDSIKHNRIRTVLPPVRNQEHGGRGNLFQSHDIAQGIDQNDPESPVGADAKSNRSIFKRKFSLFRRSNRKSETDNIIELYMNDEQLEDLRALKERPSRLARTWTKRKRRRSVHDATNTL